MADGNGDYPQQPPTGAQTSDATGDLQAQLEAARAEAAQYKDKYLREYADKDNFRKRQERMTADRVRSAQRDLLDRVLDIADNLDRAMAHQDTMDRAALQQTLRMLQWQITETLKNQGLSEVPTTGTPFDPRIHEAIETVMTEEQPEGMVVEEVRKGYKMGDEMFRPARVKVSARPQG